MQERDPEVEVFFSFFKLYGNCAYVWKLYI